MTDQMTEKMVCLIVRNAALTPRTLAMCMRRYVAACEKKGESRIGEVTLKALTKDGSTLGTCDVARKSMRDFDVVARKYAIKYSCKRVEDPSNPNPHYAVFFRSKQAAQMQEAFKEYERKILENEEKASLRETLKENSDRVKQANKERTSEKQISTTQNVAKEQTKVIPEM